MELSQFLIKAKISGYATGGEGKELKLEDGGFKFYYKEHDLEYSDIYYGFNPFFGQEIVRQNNRAIWIMNYFGETTFQRKEAVSVYQFLKLALQHPDPKLPLRGPKYFGKDNFIYRNSGNGNIDLFFGEEIIKFENKQVYKLRYHGGTIKSV
jgi:hypothetical protein